MILKVKGKTYVLTFHALQRMKSRKITKEMLVEGLSDIKKIRPIIEFDRERELIICSNGLELIKAIGKPNIITIFNRNLKYYKEKAKARRNKNRRQAKAKYGNRVKH